MERVSPQRYTGSAFCYHISKIEGTHTEFEEAVLPELAISVERRDDWREVNNYVAAMNDAVESLLTLSLSMRLLRNAHARLMEGLRDFQTHFCTEGADGLLQTVNDYKRNRIFTFTRYLDIFRDDGACIGGAF